MAETILFDLAAEILKKLGKTAAGEIHLARGAKDELRKLYDTVSTIKAVLLDAQVQQETNQQIKEWLDKLKAVFYDADDLLDDYSTELLRRKVMTGNKMAKKVRIFFSSSNQLRFRLEMTHRIEAITARLNKIAKGRKNFHFTERPDEPHEGVNKERETHSFVDEKNIIGREADKKAIIDLLLNSINIEENVSIISVVGIGGLGKTTLAQQVYNDESILKYFELKLWVCVSDVFEVKIIAEKMIESLTGKRPDYLQLDGVQIDLRKRIDGKRYFLVLDDVWNDDREKWLALKDLLKNGAMGSMILVTTREEQVATIMESVSTYSLKGLSENESWSLFEGSAFRKNQEQKEPRLIAMGKEIMKKCAGVPLAIRALGSLLYLKNTEAEWTYFKDNDLPKIAQEHDVIVPILKLSYNNLPLHLKQCFAYCSLYPKDHRIDKDELIKLWIAVGFVQPSNENELEEVGELYFMNLVRRSFLQYDGEFVGKTVFKMHDLIHDLAQSVAGTECIMANSGTKNVTEKVRHVLIDKYDIESSSGRILDLLLTAKKIRSLIHVQFYHHIRRELLCNKIISNFKLLRVLELHSFGITNLPNSIGDLYHLRYLDLSYNDGIKKLPSCIIKLQNLRTLLLNYCKSLKELPKDIRKLISLRHLGIEGCDRLRHMPHGLGQLMSLRELERFVLGKGMGLGELKDLNNLRGGLRIEGLRHVTETEEVKKAAFCLKGKEFLNTLDLGSYSELEWGHNTDGGELLLEALEPHPNLRKLRIISYGGVNFASWMIRLPNIVKISIGYCGNCQHLPQFGKLPSLKVLGLWCLESVEYIDDSIALDELLLSSPGIFPSLETLHLEDMPKLKGWWKGTHQQSSTAPPVPLFPSLANLQIKSCPNLICMPLLCAELLELEDVSGMLLYQQLMATATPVSQKAITIPTKDATSSSSSSSLVPFSKLDRLSMGRIRDVVSLPEELMRSLTSVKFLSINACNGLRSLSGGLQHLTALVSLQIRGCEELDLLEDDDGMQFQGLCSLTSLKIEDIRKSLSLPVGLQQVTTLQTLGISRCSNLISLPEWIGKLISLEGLHISECPKIASLPQGMRELSKLQELRVAKCPQLLERCRQEMGEDWPNIAHVPNVNIE